MSTILVCYKLLGRTMKPKVSTILNGLKIHTFNSLKPSILKTNETLAIPNRSFYKYFRHPTKAELRLIDDVPDHFVMIHRNTMHRYIQLAQIGTCLASVLVAAFVLFSEGSTDQELPFVGDQKHVPRSTENEFTIYIAVFLTIVISLQVMISKMPLRIYYYAKQKKYLVILPSNLPFSNKKLTCKVGDLQKLPLEGILPWRDARFRINDRELLLIDDHFRRPGDLWVMMGVQKDSSED